MQHDASREANIMRRKIIAFIDDKKHGEELASLDIKLMPRVLKTIQANCSFATFHKVMTTWNFPKLLENPSPQQIIRDLRLQVESLEGEVQITKEENDRLKRSIAALRDCNDETTETSLTV
jgi:hypothetical protein